MRQKLKDIADIQLGYQPRGWMKPDRNGSHRVIQIRDVAPDGGIRFGDLVRVAPDREPWRYEVKAGDVLFISRGRRLNAAVVPEPPHPTMAVSFFYILHPRIDLVDPAYLAWAINQPPVQAQVAKHTGGTGIPHIRRRPVEELELDVPPLGVQRQIMRLQELSRQEKRMAAELQKKREHLVQVSCLQAARNG